MGNYSFHVVKRYYVSEIKEIWKTEKDAHISHVFMGVRAHKPHQDRKCITAGRIWAHRRVFLVRTDKQDICLQSVRHSQPIRREPLQMNGFSLFVLLPGHWEPVYSAPSPECQRCGAFHSLLSFLLSVFFFALSWLFTLGRPSFVSRHLPLVKQQRGRSLVQQQHGHFLYVQSACVCMCVCVCVYISIHTQRHHLFDLRLQNKPK